MEIFKPEYHNKSESTKKKYIQSIKTLDAYMPTIRHDNKCVEIYHKCVDMLAKKYRKPLSIYTYLQVVYELKDYNALPETSIHEIKRFREHLLQVHTQTMVIDNPARTMTIDLAVMHTHGYNKIPETKLASSITIGEFQKALIQMIYAEFPLRDDLMTVSWIPFEQAKYLVSLRDKGIIILDKWNRKFGKRMFENYCFYDGKIMYLVMLSTKTIPNHFSPMALRLSEKASKSAYKFLRVRFSDPDLYIKIVPRAFQLHCGPLIPISEDLQLDLGNVEWTSQPAERLSRTVMAAIGEFVYPNESQEYKGVGINFIRRMHHEIALNPNFTMSKREFLRRYVAKLSTHSLQTQTEHYTNVTLKLK
jgi:hypothetical protein